MCAEGLNSPSLSPSATPRVPMLRLLIAALATAAAAAAPPKCTYVPASAEGTKCVAGCFIERTKLCAVNCPYRNVAGKCVK